MIHTLLITSIVLALPTSDRSAESQAVMSSPQAADSLQGVYRRGRTWDAFYEAVNGRRELWIENWTRARVPEPLAERARATGGPWRLLVITEPRCSDSVNSVPYIARLVRDTPGLEMRLIDSTIGRPWMEAHRTPDGRAATPTVLVLDESFHIRGCWIEQPAALQQFWLPVLAAGRAAAELDRKMTWYRDDAGEETLREIVELLEAAHAGRTICPGR